MKIKPEHYEYLARALVMPADTKAELVRRYEAGNFPRSDRTRDLQQRFCFDVLYMVPGLGQWVCTNLYPYMNDDHVYTALRAILPKIERKF